MQLIGKKINELRKKNNMSQEELADKLFVSSRTIIKWESGETEPSISNLGAIADIFNVTTDYLLGRDCLSNKSNKRYNNISIALTIVFIVFAICLIVGLVFSTIGMIDQIKNIVDMANKNNDAAIYAPVGLSFSNNEVNEKTIEFAASQGVDITVESDTFVQWKNSLLGLYTLRNGTWWYNYYSLINYAPLIWMIILELFLIYSLTITVILLIRNLKTTLFSKPVLNTVFAFTSLNLPAGFILLVYNLAMERK